MEAYKISNLSDICHGPKIGTALRFCVSRPIELLVVGDVLCNIFQPTIQCRTQFVQCLCFHVVISSQTSDGLAVNATLLSQQVCGNAFFLHYNPQLIKDDHMLTPLIDINQYGGYNLHC